MTTHFNVYDLTDDLKSTCGNGQHYAGADHLQIAWSCKSLRNVGDCYLVTTSMKLDPWFGSAQRYRLTAHGPVEIDASGNPTTPHQVPLLLAAAAPDGPGIEAHAFGRWYPAQIVKHTRTRLLLAVTTGSGVRPPKFYTPGEKSLRVKGSAEPAAAGRKLVARDIKSGKVVEPGAVVTDHRGEEATFEQATRANTDDRDGKVLVGGREFYARVFDLIVSEAA